MIRVLWLSVIPGASSGCQPGLADLDIERAILVRAVTGLTVKREHVKGIRVSITGRDLPL